MGGKYSWEESIRGRKSIRRSDNKSVKERL